MDGWNTTFLLGMPIFRGYVSFREGIGHWIVLEGTFYGPEIKVGKVFLFVGFGHPHPRTGCWVVV